jgi:DNA-binding response OmpR family regulator
MKILIVDEEPDVVRLITMSFGMQQPNWEVVSAVDAEEAFDALEREQPALVLLDVGLPDIDGFQILEHIRRYSDVPVIMLTVRDDELSKVRGLELGADDYITKPFSHLELLARVRAVLRRTQTLPLTHEETLVFDDLVVDFARREVTKAGEPVRLTTTEYRLLYHLVRNAGQVLPHETLLARVWGREYTDEINYLKVYVSRLRAKLEDDPHHPQHILTEYGLGYWFRQ